MQRRLHLAPVGRIAAAGRRVVAAMQFGNLTGLGILLYTHALDEVGVAQADLAAGG